MTGIVNSDLDEIWKKMHAGFDRTPDTVSRAVSGGRGKR